MPNAFAHIELTTDNLEAAKTFYGKIFDWKLNDMPGMPYTMIDVGAGGTGGGLQPRPMPEAPTGWMPYVQVASVAQTIAKVEKAGGKVLLPFQSIGDMGAIGVFADPEGSVIGVWEAGAAAPPPPATKKATKKTAKKTAAKEEEAPLKKPAKKAKTDVAPKKPTASKKVAKKTTKKASPRPVPTKKPAKKASKSAKKSKKSKK